MPYPACVGWLDRILPGWTRTQLHESLKLVRTLMLPNWDIHPEMISHTRVIDLKTGRPLEEISPATMENSYPQVHKSVDELAAYLAYALKILKNCDLPCDGITTPGGFGNLVKPELSLAVHDAVRDVYQSEIPHYFKYVTSGADTEPRVEHVRQLKSGSPKITVNIPAGTGDWFGGWTGDDVPEGHRYVNEDATAGRMVELIESNRPAVMLCHWAGMYSHGQQTGFEHFKQAVVALNTRFGDRTLWMKLSEMARYWAARELTEIQSKRGRIELNAPFAAPRFTLETASSDKPPKVNHNNDSIKLKRVEKMAKLDSGTWFEDKGKRYLCFDLQKGETTI